MAMTIIDQFDLKAAKFNFSRDYFESVDLLNKAPITNFPDHFITNVAGTLYQLTKANGVWDDSKKTWTVSPWKKLEFGDKNALTTDGNGKLQKNSVDVNELTVTNGDTTVSIEAKSGETDGISVSSFNSGRPGTVILNGEGLRQSTGGSNTTVWTTDGGTTDISGIASSDAVAAIQAKLAGINDTVKGYVDSQVGSLALALVFKGSVSQGSDLPLNPKVGDTYVISAIGEYAGETCEVGDTIICTVAKSGETAALWLVVHKNIDGAVTRGDNKSWDGKLLVGAAGNQVSSIDGTEGQIIQADANGNPTYVTPNYASNDKLTELSQEVSELKKEVIYDVSAHNNGIVFESLSALLGSDNLSTLIPTSVRHGGMSIKFIQSSDNKYVQYRLMDNEWSTTVSDWQGVDDEPVEGSDNLVKSGGVADSINQLKNAGYLYAGIATPITNPGTPEGRVFYIANGKGTYTNFGGIDVTEDEVVVLYYDTVWHKDATGIASNDKLTELDIEVNELNEEINGSEPDIDISSLLQEKCQYWNAQLNATGQPSSAFVGYEVDIKPYAYAGKKVKFKTYYNSDVLGYCGFVLADGSTSGIMQSDQYKVVQELEIPSNASKLRITWSKGLGSAYCHVINDKSTSIKKHIEAIDKNISSIEADLQDTQNSISGVSTSVDNLNVKFNGKHEEAVDLSNDAEAKCYFWNGNLSPIGEASVNINGFEVNVEQYVGRTIQFKTYYNRDVPGYCGFVLADGTTANIMQSDQYKVVQELTIPANAKYFRFSWFKSIGATYCSIKKIDIDGFDERLNELDELPVIVGGLVAESESQKLLSKKVLVIGDSISTDELSAKYFSDNRNIYPEYAEYNSYGYYNKWVYDLVAQGFLKRENVVNNSIHATGYVAHLSTYDNDFVTRIKKMADANTYDLVIVFGGINDCLQNIPLGESGGDVDTYFKPAVDEFYSYLVNNFTQARICVLLPLKNKNFFSWYNPYVDYIRSVAEGYSLPILDLNKQSGFCPSNETFCRMWTFHGQGEEYPNGDGVHPNQEYQEKYLSKQIKQFIKGLI